MLTLQRVEEGDPPGGAAPLGAALGPLWSAFAPAVSDKPVPWLAGQLGVRGRGPVTLFSFKLACDVDRPLGNT